jgi:hypothetical protein
MSFTKDKDSDNYVTIIKFFSAYLHLKNIILKSIFNMSLFKDLLVIIIKWRYQILIII